MKVTFQRELYIGCDDVG